MLSTKHAATCAKVSVRRKGGRTYKYKLDVVTEYNAYMGGVDHSDQLLSYYPINRKTFKWWKKVFMYIVNLALVNAQILYNFLKGSQCVHYRPMPLVDFMGSVLEGLIGDIPNMRAVVAFPVGKVLDPLNRHLPRLISSNGLKRHACRVCSMKQQMDLAHGSLSQMTRTRRFRFKCPLCDVPLCVENYFEVWHSKENFWE